MNGIGQAIGAPQQPEIQGKLTQNMDRLQLPPEMQEAAMKAYGLSMKAMYSGQFPEKALAMIGQAPTPEAGIGMVAGAIGARVYQAAQEAGEDLSGDVLLVSGYDLVDEVADFAAKYAGIEKTPELLERAFYVASDSLRATLGGQGPAGTPEEAQAFADVAGGADMVGQKIAGAKQAAMPRMGGM